jgi:hypothetical protein
METESPKNLLSLLGQEIQLMLPPEGSEWCGSEFVLLIGDTSAVLKFQGSDRGPRLIPNQRVVLRGHLTETPAHGGAIIEPKTFEQDLEQLINKHSVENTSNTPDFVLAAYISGCLAAFAEATKGRDCYYRFRAPPG